MCWSRGADKVRILRSRVVVLHSATRLRSAPRRASVCAPRHPVQDLTGYPIRYRWILLLALLAAVSSATVAAASEGAAARVDAGGISCSSGGNIVCLGGDGRYRVRTEWRLSDGTTGDGVGLELTRDTGAFHFFDPANLEIVVKVLDGCGVNGQVWVFAAGLTDVGVVVVVRDLVTDETARYTNDVGTPFRPIRDIEALGGCDGEPPPPTSGGLADRARRANFAIAVDQTAGSYTGRALCNARLGNQQWRSAIEFSEIDGPEHELWRICTCPQIEGECQDEARSAIDALDARRSGGG